MKVLLTTAAALLTASPLLAGTFTIDFEGPTSFASVAEYYNGGTDSAGASGPNLGVSFGGDILEVQNDELGPYFSNAPSPVGAMQPFYSDVGLNELTMNIAAGFTGLSLYYSIPEAAPAAVQIWSGLDHTGTLLASISFSANFDGATDDPYSVWTQTATATWSGIAKSATFTNAGVHFAGIDNITITPVPEPTCAVVFAVAMAGLLPLRRFR